jgi:hypothetical protein
VNVGLLLRVLTARFERLGVQRLAVQVKAHLQMQTNSTTRRL